MEIILYNVFTPWYIWYTATVDLEVPQIFHRFLKLVHITILYVTRKNCFRYLKLMSLLKKNQLFDLEVKGQGPTKVMMVCDTPPYGHAPTYQISLTYLERQKSYGLDKLRWEEAEVAEEEKIRLKQCLPSFEGET